MNSDTVEETFKKISSILISQPEPQKHTEYHDIAEKYGIKIDYRKFIHIEEVEMKEIRKARVKPDEFPSIIFTGRNAVDYFFKTCEGMRIKMPQDTKYFCTSEAIAQYLHKYIIYRKRKVFYGKRRIEDLVTSMTKYKESDQFLLPCSNLGSKKEVAFLEEHNFNYKELMLYRTVASDLSDLADITYDVLVFFSPLGIDSLFENFPDFKQNETRFAIFGKQTQEAVLERGLRINIKAPDLESPSMSGAIKKYLKQSNPL